MDIVKEPLSEYPTPHIDTGTSKDSLCPSTEPENQELQK